MVQIIAMLRVANDTQSTLELLCDAYETNAGRRSTPAGATERHRPVRHGLLYPTRQSMCTIDSYHARSIVKIFYTG
jgi:hypothetical protein